MDGTEFQAQETPETNLVNVLDPDTREIGSIPSAQLEDALSQGYVQPSSAEVDDYIKQQKYGSTSQQVLSGLEGAGVGASFGLSTGVEEALGVKPEDIRARREVNPFTHMLGEGAGLAASSFIPGAGAFNLISDAGKGAAALTGLGEASTLAKVGSGAVRAATENILVQGGDEFSKMLSADPDQSVQTALTNIGLAGIFGGTLGAGVETLNPLWKATMGGKVGQVLKALSDKAGGIDGVVPDALNEAISKSGLDMAPEIRAGLSQNPEIQNAFKALQQSDTTKSGQKFQQAYQDFKMKSSESMLSALGKTTADVDALSNLSENEIGKQLQKSLIEELKAKTEPFKKEFAEIEEKFKGVPLLEDVNIPAENQPALNPYLPADQQVAPTTRHPGTISKISDEIGSLAHAEGYTISPSSPEAQMINRIQKELPNLKTLEDLRNYQSIIGKNAQAQQLYHLGGELSKIFRNAEENIITGAMAETAPHMLETHALARSQYKEFMNLADELNARLHVGKYRGADTFISNLSEMAPEVVLRRLSGKGDANLLSLIAERFPQSAQAIKDFSINNILKTASMKATAGEVINTRFLMNSIEKMSPELRGFAVSPEALQKVQSIGKILDTIDSMPHNFSNTARTIDKLWSYVPGSAMGMATVLTGHNPVSGLIVGGLTKWLGRDVPDAVRLAALKFLGSNQPIESEGFKAMVDFIHHTLQGENLIGKSTKNVFKSGAEVLPQAFMPSEKSKKKLDKQLEEVQLNPQKLFNVTGKTAHYLPEHGQAIAQTAANAANYLNSIRPRTDKRNPLDSEVKPSAAEKAVYDRALAIAEQPLLVLDHIKKGILTPQDIAVLHNVAPALQAKLAQKLSSEMIEWIHKGNTIPYKTRLGLSLFLGQPLDSTMTPEAILSAQPMARQPQQPQMGAPRAKHSMTALNKLPGMSETMLQSRERGKRQ